MLRPKRNQPLNTFSLSDNLPVLLLLALIFICGLAIVWMHHFPWIFLYILLWGLSYPVIYAGACRYCAYYGRKCPIPFEGSCVHHFFQKKDARFGLVQLLWATIAYGFRIILPAIFIFRYHMIAFGIIYFSLLTVFWIIHLSVSGCPNCVNTQCPLNPEYNDKQRLL